MGLLIPEHITVVVKHVVEHEPAIDRKLDALMNAVTTLTGVLHMVASEVQALKVKADALKAAADKAEAKLEELRAQVAELLGAENLSQETKDVLAQIDETLTTETTELDAGSTDPV